MNDHSDDNDLMNHVRQAVAGDRTALKLLLVDMHDGLDAYLRPRVPVDLRARVDAEDILQETYTQVFRNIERFEDRGQDSFPRWVRTIALRRLRNEIAKARTAKRGGDARAVRGDAGCDDSWVGLVEMLSSPDRSPSRSVAGHEAVAAVQTAMAALPQQYRQAIELVYLQGCSVAAAAARMNRTERAIHGLCRRGLAVMRRRIGSATGFLSSGP